MKYTASIYTLAVFLITGIIVTGTSSAAGDKWRRKKDKSANERQPAKETYLDTLNQGQEISLAKDNTPVEVEKVETAPVTDTKKDADGFRIQLMASTSPDKLRAKKDEIESQLNLKVYIEHDEPYYKVYVGDFTHRDKADKELAKVKESGYPDAWIVKTKIFVDD